MYAGYKGMRRKRRQLTYTQTPALPEGPPAFFGRGSYVASTISLGVCGALLGGYYGGSLAAHCGLLVGSAAGGLWALGWKILGDMMARRRITPMAFIAFVCFVGGLVGAPLGLLLRYGLLHDANVWRLALFAGFGWMTCGFIIDAIRDVCGPTPDDDWDI